MKDISNSNVLITGGGSGVGLHVARLCLDAGAFVTIMGRSADKLIAAQADLRSDRLFIFTGDVTRSEDADAAVTFAAAQAGQPVDVLINNAGVILRKSAQETSDAEWAHVMNINVTGLFYMSRACARQMPDGGAIVNLSSTCGRFGAAGLTAYCASKGAVDQITRTMALELTTRKIRVNAVAPGAINSPMLFSEHESQDQADTVVERNEASIPLGAVAEPKEIARAILFLMREQHVTGSILRIDGGYTA